MIGAGTWCQAEALHRQGLGAGSQPDAFHALTRVPGLGLKSPEPSQAWAGQTLVLCGLGKPLSQPVSPPRASQAGTCAHARGCPRKGVNVPTHPLCPPGAEAQPHLPSPTPGGVLSPQACQPRLALFPTSTASVPTTRPPSPGLPCPAGHVCPRFLGTWPRQCWGHMGASPQAGQQHTARSPFLCTRGTRLTLLVPGNSPPQQGWSGRPQGHQRAGLHQTGTGDRQGR